jgi:hypothetical protein
VTFQDHVLPIFTNHCTGCHNADKKKGDLDLSSYSATMAGGGSGDIAAAGDSASSTLFKVITHLTDPKMPPKKPKISDAEILTIKKWIDGGLIEAPGGKARKAKGPSVDLALNAGATGRPKGPPAMPEDLLLEPEIRTRKAEAVTALAASPWAPLAAVGGQHQVLLYNTDTLDLAGILPFPERRPTILRFSRSGSLLLAGGGHGAKLGRVVLYDVRSGDRVAEIGQEFDQVLAADLSPDQGLVALGGPGKLVKIYDTRGCDLEHSIKKHTDWVTALEFSPDGVLLASGDRSGGLHVWEARTGRIFYTLAGHKAAITDLSWRSDANLLASSSEDGQVMLWEMANGTRVKAWSAHPAASSVKYSMDGRLVTCGRDMLVRTWDGNGAKLKDFEAFSDLALRAVYSHDGARVIAGDWTGEIRVWTAADAKRVGVLSTNPPSLADRLAADLRALDAALAESDKEAARLQSVSVEAAHAAKALATADQMSAAAAAKVAEADKAVEALKDAQPPAEDARKQAEAARAEAKKALAAAQAQAAAAKKQSDAATTVQAQSKSAADTAAAKADQARARVAMDRAAQFNVQVYAAKRELAKVQAEYDALGARGEDARRAAAEADGKAQAGEQAIGAARAKIQPLQAALAEAQAGPAKAEALLRAAQKAQADRDARAAQALSLATQLADSARQGADDAALSQAAAKAKESADLLAKDAADAKAISAARAGDLEKARAAVPAAEKALSDAQAAGAQAVRNAASLKTAAKAAQDRIAPEQSQAEVFKPKLEAARAKVDALKAEYLKLKPKAS